jgi:hypothetical protein
MIAMAVFVPVFILVAGLLMLRLHQLPMQIAQTEQKAQYEVVAVLCVLALFTQENLYWIAALLLAVIDIPDFTGWFVKMAGWTERIAAKERTSSSASRSPVVREEPRSSPCTDTKQHGKAHQQQINP